MAKALTPEQNEHFRAAAERLVKARGLNRTSLGRLIGISQPAAGRLLGGGGASFATAQRLAAVLGVSVEAMLRGEGTPAIPVRDLSGYAEARAMLESEFAAPILDAATRALEAAGAVEVDGPRLLDACEFVRRHRHRTEGMVLRDQIVSIKTAPPRAPAALPPARQPARR